MKRLAVLLAALPGAALAHGGHGAVAGGAHDLLHLGPALLGLVAVGLVVAVLWRERTP